jgi:replicative DNA helicase
MDIKKETFTRYGKDFQEKLCRLMIEDRPFCDQMEEVLDINFFEKAYLRAFAALLLDYRREYSTHPTYDLLAMKIKGDITNLDSAIQIQVREFYARVLSSMSEIKEAEWVKDKSLDFCRKQVLKKAMIDSVKLLKSSSFDEIQKVIEVALRLGTDNNFGHDYLMDFEDRFLIKARNPVSTGWSRVDDICKGGIGSSELGVVIAPTGAGKSMVLVSLGAQAVQDGKTVVHYTLELSDTAVGSRYDSKITGVPLRDLFHSKELIRERIQDVEGNLIIKEYPTKSASTSTIANHIERLKKRGIIPDLIIVDYADLLRPVKASSEKRHDLENIYEELRGIAQTIKCPVWTASQTNRSGLNAEIITMEAISEAFNKCFVADFIFSLSRTAADKQANTGRIFIAKNRNGPDGLVFPVFADWASVSMKVLDRSDGEEEKVQPSSKETLNYVKQKYAQLNSRK